MSMQRFLDQMLRTAQSQMGGAAGAIGVGQGKPGLGDFAKGALGGGALGLLLGNKRTRGTVGKVAAVGGLAALGVLAYKAYNDYKAQQPGAAVPAQGTTADRAQGAEVEQHARAVLAAIVAAAKADGHVDARERQLIDEGVAKLGAEPALQAWLQAELATPLDPAKVAAQASTPALAHEMFLASVLVADEQNFMEKAYLDELARQLRIEPGLRLQLEQQARAAG